MSGIGDRETPEQSFNFAKLPNIEEVTFTLRQVDGDSPWILKALSTLKPTTTPHLSVLQFNLGDRTPGRGPIEWGRKVGDGVPLMKRQVTRIRREFAGAVNVIVHRYPGFPVGGSYFGFP